MRYDSSCSGLAHIISTEVTGRLFDVIQCFPYLHGQPQPAKINLTWERKPHPLRLLYSSGQGFATLPKVSSNALRVILAKPLILCIEDEPIHLTLRKKVLERDGYDVIGVTTAADALAALIKCPVSAIIADHMLQGTTGTELAKKMKRIKPTVPIILFSGTIPQHLNCVDVYVNKGEPTATFLSIVREVVQRSCS